MGKHLEKLKPSPATAVTMPRTSAHVPGLAGALFCLPSALDTPERWRLCWKSGLTWGEKEKGGLRPSCLEGERGPAGGTPERR